MLLMNQIEGLIHRLVLILRDCKCIGYVTFVTSLVKRSKDQHFDPIEGMHTIFIQSLKVQWVQVQAKYTSFISIIYCV